MSWWAENVSATAKHKLNYVVKIENQTYSQKISIDIPNTVKNSKNYSWLARMTCFDTTFNVNHLIKSSVTF